MTDKKENDKSSGVQVITRAANILNILGAESDGLSLGKIATAANLPRSTVQRLVGALESVDLLQNGEGGLTLGPAFLRLVSSVHTDVVTAMRPGLEALAELTGETVALTRPSGKNLTVLHCAVAAGELQVTPRLGFGRPLYSTSAGRALLALQSDEEVRRLFSDEFRPPHDFSIQTISGLIEVLNTIRQDGISYDHGEMIEGVKTMAIGMNTRIGHLSVSMLLPFGRFEKKHEFCRESLNEFRKKITREIGVW